MSVRRSAPSPPALPGTLCGPALALAPGVATGVSRPKPKPKPKPKPNRKPWDDDHSSDEEGAPASAPGPVGGRKKGLGGMGPRFSDAPDASRVANKDMDRIASMERANAEADQKYPSALKQKRATGEQMLGMYYYNLYHALRKFEEQILNYFSDEEGNNGDQLRYDERHHSDPDKREKMFEEYLTRMYPFIFEVRREKQSAKNKYEASNAIAGIMHLIDDKHSTLRAAYELIVPDILRIIEDGKEKNRHGNVTKDNVVTVIGEFVQDYTALMMAPEVWSIPKFLAYAGQLKYELAARRNDINQKWTHFFGYNQLLK